MKRSLLILAALSLSACEPNDANRQQIEAAKTLDQTYRILEHAESDSRDQKRDIAVPIDEYRRAQLAKASATVAPLTTQGRAAQQMSSQLLVAESHASAGRAAASAAALAASRNGPLASDLFAAASQLREASHTAKAHAALDFSPTLTALRDSQKELTATKDGHADEVRTLSTAIKQLETELAETSAGAKAKAAESDDLARHAFQAKGQAQYDLYVKSAAASRAADQLIAKSEMIAAKLSVENAKLAVAQAQLTAATEQLAETQDAIKSLDERQAATQQLAGNARKSADEAAAQIDATFKAIATTQQETVNAGFEKATKSLEQAVTHAQSAAQSAPQDGKPHADLSVGMMQAQLGYALRQQAVVNATYADLLKSLSESVTGSLPEDRAKPIADAAAEAQTRADSAREQARTLLAKSNEQLQRVADEAKALADKEFEATALDNLIQVNMSLTAIGGEAGDDRLNSLKSRRDALE